MRRRYLGSADAMTGPHDFDPLGRFLHRRKCKGCYLTPEAHPVRGWVASRPLGDKSAGGRETT